MKIGFIDLSMKGAPMARDLQVADHLGLALGKRMGGLCGTRERAAMPSLPRSSAFETLSDHPLFSEEE